MSQRYFLTTESAYEKLRLDLDAQLGYPKADAVSIFTPALQSPRDSLRRIVLAVDDGLPHYAEIVAKIEPLLASASAQELTEAEYLAFLVCVSEGGGVPLAHAASHAVGGADALTPAGIGAAAASHAHGNITNSGSIGSTPGLLVVTGQSGVLTTSPAASMIPQTGVIPGGYGSPTSIAAFAVGLDGRLTSAGNVSIAIPASAVTSGTFDIARIPTGTSSTTVSLGNHTHAQLHDRSHAITSSSDHTATAWRAFYSNGSGVITELALGASGTVLTSGGASAAPSFAALPAGGTKTLARFTPGENQPPSANFATLDTRNSVLVLEFDAATDESAVFVGYIPEGTTLTNGLKVRLSWMADTATSGNVRWGVQFEADGTDLDSDSFDTATLVTSAANGTSGIETVAEITATSIDSLAAGDRFRLKVYRDADDATNDTMTGDAQLVTVEVQVA